MGAGAMVALAVILPHQLPISLLYDGRLVGDLGVLQAVRHHVGRDAGLHRREVRRDGRETDEDVAGDRLAVHRLQPVGRGIEGWAHVAREEQTALEVIGPLVVGTRSEEHTSELQSLMSNSYAVFCLEKKKRTM